MSGAIWRTLADGLDAFRSAGRRAQFWLRDDDAVGPSAALDRLLELALQHRIPVALAVIPARATDALAARLAKTSNATVLVHGWSHENHAGHGEKKQELGRHRPAEVVCAELADALAASRARFGARSFPVLVPPWNRIDQDLVGSLPALGYVGLSTFGKALLAALPVVNSTVDIVDWRGGRGGRDVAVLFAEIAAQLHERLADPSLPPVGILTHHLVHDEAAWNFLERLFAQTSVGAGCDWLSVERLFGSDKKRP